MVVVRQEWIDAAREAGACRIPCAAGDDVSSISARDLLWVASALPTDVVASVESEVGLPLWAVGHSARGDGSWYANGYGYANGDGDGDGYGDGYGDGDGRGYGDGYGYGDGRGNVYDSYEVLA